MKNTVRSLRRQRVNAPAKTSGRPASLIETVEPRILFAVFEVNTTADTVDANAQVTSLREAIIAANAAPGFDDIIFSIGLPTDGSVRTIALTSPLPEVTDLVSIDGTTNPGYEIANVPVIELNGAGAGANANGLVLNTTDVEAASNVLGLIINRFSGNGVVIRGDYNLVIDSYIGTNGAGTGAGPGNAGHGVLIEGGYNNFVAENIIAHNGLDGVAVVNVGTEDALANDVTLNSFFANGGLPVDLGNDGVTANDANDADSGPNGLQNFPVLDVPTLLTGGGLNVTGTINSTPNTLINITFYGTPSTVAQGDVEGQTIIDSLDVVTNESGFFRFEMPLPEANITDWITATSNKMVTTDIAFEVTGSEFSAPVTRAVTPTSVQVSQVFVNGPTLTNGAAAFKAAAGVDATFGYAVPGGVVQTTPLSWVGGINAVSVRFTQDVASALGQGDLVINGSAGPVATTGFTYDAATRTGTWTFAAVTRDKLRFLLDDAGISGLDGEWTNPTEAFPGVGGDSYPSGDGTSGGDFNFRLNVLNGDVSGDGQVNATDVAEIKRRLTRRPNDGVTDPLRMYTIFSDITGDGVINANDLAQVKARLTQRINTLPNPATALLFSAASIEN